MPTKPMNPKKLECRGLFLFGAGYYARDDNTLGIVTGRKTPPHFCMRCPIAAECEKEHQTRVADQMPEAVELFERAIIEAHNRGIPLALVAAKLGALDKDPYALVAAQNFEAGHRARGKISGTLVGGKPR